MPIRNYKDLDLNFNASPVSGDVTTVNGNQAVIKSIENLLLTNHYEIPFHGDIGANITKLLFENITELTAAALQKEITNTINNFEPRATISYVAVVPDYNNDGMNVYVECFINNSVEPVVVTTFLKRITI